jgi:hypothetical protein
MAITNKCIVEPVVLGVTATSYYTAPVNTSVVIKKATVSNVGSAAAKVTLYLIPSGGTAPSGETTPAVAVAVGRSLELFEIEGHVLNAGDSISALSDTASTLSLRISGVEVV